jgi:hypothetical protein
MSRRPNERASETRIALPAVYLARDNRQDVVRARVRSRQWQRVSRGVYLPVDPAAPDRRRAVALARVMGLHERLRAPHWFSHESAALLWGLPLWITPTRTHLMQEHTAGSGRDAAVRHHPVVPPLDQRGVATGLPVTSLERTVVDCASSLPPMHGLVVADAGLRAGADRALLGRILENRAGHRGVLRARAVIELADDGAESPGESAARFVVVRDGFPAPLTQVPVVTRLGTFWSDLGWPQWRILLEYDGRAKYDGRGTDELIQEKRRHDAIVEAGWRALRVTKEDLPGSTLANRLLPLLPAAAAGTLRPRRDLRG